MTTDLYGPIAFVVSQIGIQLAVMSLCSFFMVIPLFILLNLNGAAFFVLWLTVGVYMLTIDNLSDLFMFDGSKIAMLRFSLFQVINIALAGQQVRFNGPPPRTPASVVRWGC